MFEKESTHEEKTAKRNAGTKKNEKSEKKENELLLENSSETDTERIVVLCRREYSRVCCSQNMQE